MKRVLSLIVSLLVCGVAYSQAFDANGATKSVFSVSPTKKVRFSKGNLQYQASTGTWRFAEHQYDFVGEGNKNISSTYDGWIDLFGWGTSGWNSGANAYKPYHTSNIEGDYYVGGDYRNSLTGEYAKADWGVYNAISNGGNKARMWRTLTEDEWEYLLYERKCSRIDGVERSAEARFVKASVCGVNGLVVFPDEYAHPADALPLQDVGNKESEFDRNVIKATMWQQMEKAGCIFLPAAGCRFGTGVHFVGTYGLYWSSTYGNEGYAWVVYFYGDFLYMFDYYRGGGQSVRLVRDY